MDPREFEEIRRSFAEIQERQKRVPPMWAVVAAFLVPSVVGLIGGGQLVRQVEDNREVNIRQEAHIETIDARLGVIERQAAVMAVLIRLNEERMNVVEPFRDSPESPPGSKRQQH